MAGLNQFKQVKKNVVLSVSVQMVSFFVSLILNLLLPKYVTEQEYSYWQIFLLYVSYVPLLHLGFLDGLILRFSQYEFDSLDKPLIRTQFKIFFVIEILFSSVGMIFAQLLFDGTARLLLSFISFAIVTTNLYTYTSYLFQLTNRIRKYAFLVLMLRVVLGGGCLALVVVGDVFFYEICLVYFVAHIAAIVWGCCHNQGLYCFGKSVPLREGWIDFKKNILAGLTLLAANLSSMLMVGGAKMVVQWNYDVLVFGQVAFAFNVSNLFLTFITAASIAVFPSLKRLDKDCLPEFYFRIRNSFSPFLFLSLVAYFPGFFILNYWLPSYRSSLVYLGALMPIVIYSSRILLLTNNYLKALRKEKILLMINCVSLVFAFAFFMLFAYASDSILLILLSLVAVVIAQSIFSELIVMKLLNKFQIRNFIAEFVLTVCYIFVVLVFNGIV